MRRPRQRWFVNRIGSRARADERRRMTVRFVFEGHNAAETAHLLGLSIHTIRGYISDVGHIPRTWNAPDKGRFYLFEAARIQMRMPVEDLERLGAVKSGELWWKPGPPPTRLRQRAAAHPS